MLCKYSKPGHGVMAVRAALKRSIAAERWLGLFMSGCRTLYGSYRHLDRQFIIKTDTFTSIDLIPFFDSDGYS